MFKERATMKKPLMKKPWGRGDDDPSSAASSTSCTKGKRLGQHAFIGRAAQGQRGGGMRALGVFENWAGKCVGCV